jgi:hypothetical protein
MMRTVLVGKASVLQFDFELHKEPLREDIQTLSN